MPFINFADLPHFLVGLSLCVACLLAWVLWHGMRMLLIKFAIEHYDALLKTRASKNAQPLEQGGGKCHTIL